MLCCPPPCSFRRLIRSKGDCIVTEPGWTRSPDYLLSLGGEVPERLNGAVSKADQAVNRKLRESNGLPAPADS